MYADLIRIFHSQTQHHTHGPDLSLFARVNIASRVHIFNSFQCEVGQHQEPSSLCMHILRVSAKAGARIRAFALGLALMTRLGLASAMLQAAREGQDAPKYCTIFGCDNVCRIETSACQGVVGHTGSTGQGT